MNWEKRDITLRGQKYGIFAGKPTDIPNRWLYLLKAVGKKQDYSLWLFETEDDWENCRIWPYEGEDTQALIVELMKCFMEHDTHSPDWYFQQGEAVQKAGDNEKASGYYLVAAQRGHANAQLNLGFLHYYGQGVPQNDNEAFAWFNKAATQPDKFDAKSYFELLVYKGILQRKTVSSILDTSVKFKDGFLILETEFNDREILELDNREYLVICNTKTGERELCIAAALSIPTEMVLLDMRANDGSTGLRLYDGEDRQKIIQESADEIMESMQKILEKNEIWKANETIKRNPNDVDAYICRSKAYLSLDQCDKAISDINHAIELDPDNFNAYWARSIIYLLGKQWDLLIADTSKMIELNPNDAAAYAYRGEAYRYTNQWDLARADLEKVLQLDSEHKQAKESLEKVMQNIG